MSENGRTSPGSTMATPTSRPGSSHSASLYDAESSAPASEYTPLLANENGDVEAPDRSNVRDSSAASLLRSFQNGSDKAGNSRRWPSLLALFLLCVVVVLIIIFAFFVPGVVQEYAVQAATFEPTSLSIDSFTDHGVRARIQGDFTMDASKVKKKSVRDIGRFGTWIARKVDIGQSHVQVSLPEYDDVLLGTAALPPMTFDIRNTHTTHVDFLSDLQPGDVAGIRRIAKDWLDGRLGRLLVLGKASVPLKSGLFNLGTQTIMQAMLFAGDDIPSIPDYKIHKLNFHEVDLPDFRKSIQANVSVTALNPYPLDFIIPPLGFALLVDSCGPNDPHIQLADATTGSLHVEPKRSLDIDVGALVRRLPESFTQACPGTHESPMDSLLGSYIHGNDTTVYVRGSDSPSLDTPRWITDLISDITVPIPLPGHTFGDLIKNFTLANVDFGLPDPLADPGTPEASPHISARVKALVVLPEEMNFNVNVTKISADADVFYHGSKLGVLDLKTWQPANSTRVDTSEEERPLLAVESLIENAPLNITDDNVFTELIQALLFGGNDVVLKIKADVNVELITALGQLVVRKIPAEGAVPVKRS